MASDLVRLAARDAALAKDFTVVAVDPRLACRQAEPAGYDSTTVKSFARAGITCRQAYQV